MPINNLTIKLPKNEIPRVWYNVLPDLPEPLPPYLTPGNVPVEPQALAAIFPPALIEQELSTKRHFDIPEPVVEALSRWRPTPLTRAVGLEKALGVRSMIFYKNESVSPSGSHKSNTAMAQAHFNKIAGIRRLATETGAGQWGTALAIAGQYFNLDVRVFMVRVSLQQKPYRKTIMNLMGAEVLSSPSTVTNAGREAIKNDPDTLGTLGLAISEAVEEAASRSDTNYSLGSVLNHVLLHQTVIGQEIKKQLDIAGVKPDYLIACHGGGSNFGGMAVPFVPDVLSGQKINLIAAEPESCPSLSKGKYGHDHGDVAGLTPLLPMYSLGKDFQPPAIHAGGLRYHGASPIVSSLVKSGIVVPETVGAYELFQYAKIFSRTEFVIPAPESAHALAVTCRKALELEKEANPGVLVFVLSGHGLLDLSAYEDYLSEQPEKE
ncbi:MAG: TrpB-like pyridoxal phosphate-dependent enzyme [Deltaproteobacteria bacterium]|jgi:tryptophan synthase beta chain|nr:TrpB-like pyridoxal phosphate-dependent enzyme [Deltaproteobacteria bacterium]